MAKTPKKPTQAELKAAADKQAENRAKGKPAVPAKKAPKKSTAKKKPEVVSKEQETQSNENHAIFRGLKGYLSELKNMLLSVNEENGKLRSRIKAILTKEDWHKGAFGDIRKIEKMSKTARADYLRTFKPLFDIMYEAEWKQEIGDLLSELEAESDPEETEFGEVDDAVEQGKVVSMPGAKKARPTSEPIEATDEELAEEVKTVASDRKK